MLKYLVHIIKIDVGKVLLKNSTWCLGKGQKQFCKFQFLTPITFSMLTSGQVECFEQKLENLVPLSF